MSVAAGSYQNIIGGVSEQAPQDRREGQHFVQDNFISDAVTGLALRRGSVLVEEKRFADFDVNHESAVRQDSQSFKSFDYSFDGIRYTLFYRSKEKSAGSTLPLAFCVHKPSGTLIDVVLNDDDEMIEALENGGVSSLVNIRDYVYLAGNTVVPEYTQNNQWDSNENRQWAAIQVMTQQYGRKFSINLEIEEISTGVKTVITAQTETPKSSYQGVLDTSDIAFDDPEYQPKVNLRNEAYQTAVTQWIGTSSAASQPAAIARSLAADLRAKALTAGFGSTQIDITPADTPLEITSHISIHAKGDYRIASLTCSDGGDENSIRAAFLVVTGEQLLTARHMVGHVVKVNPTGSAKLDEVYVIAQRLDGSINPGAGIEQVSWKETAGQIVRPSKVFAFATMKDNKLYIAGSANALSIMTAIDVPDFNPSTVGDTLTQTVPVFLGKKIDFLGQFQDRMIIGCGGTLIFSQSGDFLNFFRTSVRTIANNDPIEFFSTSSQDDDTIVASCTFMQNFILFGKRRQYVMNGRATITPTSVNIAPSSSYENSVDAFPEQSGDFIFYGKYSGDRSSMNQMQVGLVDNSPQSVDISQQVGRYIQGRPIEIKAMTSPNIVLMRTDADPHQIYVYSYIDASGDRKMASWSKWTWDQKIGYAIGLSHFDSEVFIPTIRKAIDRNGVAAWFICVDKFSTSTQLSFLPYLDSARSYQRSYSINDTINFYTPNDDLSVAFDGRVPEKFMGQSRANGNLLVEAYTSSIYAAWVGFNIKAVVTPTNPYVRDSKDKAILGGNFVIGTYKFGVANSSALGLTVSSPGRPDVYSEWNARKVARFTGVLGVQPVAENDIATFGIGREINSFKYSIKNIDWLPLTITAIEYRGQFFSNVRRF